MWGKTVLAGPVQLHAVGCFQLSTTRRTNTGGLEDFKSHFAQGRAYRFLKLFSKRSCRTTVGPHTGLGQGRQLRLTSCSSDSSKLVQGVCKYRGPSQGSRCHLLERTALGTHRVTHKTNRVSKSWAQWLSEPRVPTGAGRRDGSDLEEQLSLGVERDLGEEARVAILSAACAVACRGIRTTEKQGLPLVFGATCL